MRRELNYYIKLLPVLLMMVISSGQVRAQGLYFPPDTTTWDSITHQQLGWCPDSVSSLHDFLDSTNTKAFIVLSGGKMAVEWYYDGFSKNKLWYWASAGKSLMAMLVGIAQQEGHLDLDDKTSDYLGQGWTSCSGIDEDMISIKHQLRMSSGLDDGVPDNHCTDDTCLICLANPGTRWAYHNAPYSLLREVMEDATGMNINVYYSTRIGNHIDATGAYIPLGYNNIFLSTARSMVRYGLLVQAKGIWDGDTILSDTSYFHQMVNTSQSLNKSYGYLWWLNGKGEYMLPGSQFVFQADIIPNAPPDLIAALGLNDQKIYVVPSKNLVVIRMGNEGGYPAAALTAYDNDIWKKISGLECNPAGIEEAEEPKYRAFYPNPAHDVININQSVFDKAEIYDTKGGFLRVSSQSIIDVSDLQAGMYYIRLYSSGVYIKTEKLIIR